jgi:type IV secretion system protein VirD4
MRVQIIIPIEYVQVWASALRLLIGSAIQSKLRNIHAPPLSMLVDEAGQLGHFPSLRELYTFGRGAKLFGLCAWQEVSQIYNAFGHHGANEIIGSAQFRVFKGVRTLDTARLVSEMSGTMTLDYDAAMKQSDARRLKQQAAHSVLSGGSFFEAAADLRHYRDAEVHRTKQARALFTPDEVMNLAPSQMIAFASGLVEGAILGHWLMYFEQPRLAGRYLPNPHHDPQRVRIQARLGKKMVRVVEEPVPEALAHLPQYQGGTWRYIEGYRPKLR